jgi:hypothetical protein
MLDGIAIMERVRDRGATIAARIVEIPNPPSQGAVTMPVPSMPTAPAMTQMTNALRAGLLADLTKRASTPLQLAAAATR